MTRNQKERIMFDTLSNRGILCTADVQNAIREGFRVIADEQRREKAAEKEARRIRAAKSAKQAEREGRGSNDQ